LFRKQLEAGNMAPRANWKGYLKLSLVSCAVALYPASSTSSRVRFNIINKATGNRVHNQVVDAETGDPVEAEERVKGYREGSRYILLDDEELDRVALESTHTIDIEAFVPREEVDELYLDTPYYIVPDDKVAFEAFAVIREAMRKKGVVGLARVVLHRREHVLMLEPRDKGLVGITLRYADEVRPAETYFEDIPEVKIAPDMLDLAVHILETKQAHFDPTHFQDRYEKALKDLIKAKRAGKEPPAAPPPQAGNVVNLMDALRRSVQADSGGTPKKSAERTAPSARRKATGRKTGPRTRLKKAG
jgi:DNA end-binding protein Ku